MTGTRTMVFGDDGSPGADLAWQWIDGHPWPGWTLTVLTGQKPPFEDWAAPATPKPWTPPWPRAASPASEFESVELLSADADPRILLDTAAADLTVVGPPGGEPAALGWLGSTSEWLLHHPSNPLAIVRSPRASTVVCCVDGSTHATRALETFASLPLAREVAIDLVVVDDGRTTVDPTTSAAIAVLHRARLEGAPRTLHGRPTSALLDHLDRVRPDLVVLGTRGLTPWGRLTLGSTAGAIAHHVSATVVVASDSASEAPSRLG
jgi:nucleotide-binding universal stress UspA family protein